MFFSVTTIMNFFNNVKVQECFSNSSQKHAQMEKDVGVSYHKKAFYPFCYKKILNRDRWSVKVDIGSQTSKVKLHTKMALTALKVITSKAQWSQQSTQKVTVQTFSSKFCGLYAGLRTWERCIFDVASSGYEEKYVLRKNALTQSFSSVH